MHLQDSFIRKLFPTALVGDLMSEEMGLIAGVNELLLRASAHLTPLQLTAQGYWNSVTDYRRERLLEILTDDVDRRRLIAAERNLCTRVAKLDREVSTDKISQLVQRDLDLVERVEGMAELVSRWRPPCLPILSGSGSDSPADWQAPAQQLRQPGR